MRLVLCSALFALCSNCFSQSYISRQKAIDDISFYHKTILEVHYNPFLLIGKKEYFSKVEALTKTLPDSISAKDFIILMYRISSLLKDGHNSPYLVQPLVKDELRKEQFFPYNLVIENKRLYVPQSTAMLSGLPTGAEIVSINNKYASSFVPQMAEYIGGNEAYAIEMSAKLFSYFLFLSDIKAPFHIQYLDSSPNKKNMVIEKGLKFGEALAVTMPHIRAEYTFRTIDDKLGYIDFMSMGGDMNSFGRFLDSCFTIVKNTNIKNVAIDIRKNSGGNSMLGDLLLSYFTTKKYLLMGGRSWRISQQYKDYLLASGDTASSYLKKENGSLWELGDCTPEENRFKNDNIFSGNVYLLTGPFTFSSANMIADGAKQFKLAEIIGQPTGENTNDFGETYVFSLPGSKVKMQTTTSFDYGADCNKKIHQPVMPDKIISYTLHDRIYEKDKTLEYILNKLK